MSRTFKATLSVAVLAVGALAVPSFAVPIVANGDFETDANLFTTFPGYVGQAGNPQQVTDFTSSQGNVGQHNYGVNPGNGAGAPFRDNGNDGTNVLFIQDGSNVISQSISGFTFGYKYTLDFDYNARGCCGGTAGIDVTIAGYSTGNIVDTPVGGSNAYHHATITFLGGSSGTETLAVKKYDAVAGDSTALFDNFVITQIATPEPASLSLLGFGAVGLLARRRHA